MLSRSVQQLSSSLFNVNNSGSHGHAIIGVVQAEVLLSNYFFAVGRLLEGRYHCGAATSLTISCHLNIITRGSAQFAAGGSGRSDMDHVVAEGERINAFWTVYALDTSWAVALGSPSAMSQTSGGSIAITTPWPLGMTEYEQVNSRENSTLLRRDSPHLGVTRVGMRCLTRTTVPCQVS